MNLEEIIRNNRELFDTNEPDQAHFKKFRQKINLRFRKNRQMIIFGMNKYAAIFVAGLFLSLAILISVLSAIRSREQENFALNNPELIEVEYFYQTKIIENISRIKNIAKNNDDLPSRHILNDINKVNQSIKNLKKDLYYHPNDERIMDALINSYRVKLEITDQVLNLTIQSNS